MHLKAEILPLTNYYMLLVTEFTSGIIDIFNIITFRKIQIIRALLKYC